MALLRPTKTADTYHRGAVTAPAIVPRRTLEQVAREDGWVGGVPQTDVTALPGPTPMLRPPTTSGFVTDVGGGMPGTSSIDWGVTGISIGGGGVSAGGVIAGIPINVNIPFPGSGSEPPSAQPAVPGTNLVGPQSPAASGCPGLFQVRGPDGTCIDLTALPPGGDPAVVGQIQVPHAADGYGAAVKGYFGVGIMPRVNVQTIRHCPPGTALGKDGVCYEGLGRNSPKRMWPMGEKPLMTGGDRAAIRRAKSVATKLLGARKSLKKAGKALEKVGC